ncbi:GFA family protein [Shewanella khirikhana]|uniref:GFA family protein n=1 Tax=Shewanella khirikhana TaxID=1965282 RepID=UPI0030CF4BC3
MLTGGCLCGYVRYALDGEPIDAGFCHCRQCQRSSGAPVLAWLTLPFGGLRYTSGKVRAFKSSGDYQREFCPECGTQIAFRAQHQPQRVDITLGSLDEPDSVTPEYHIWCQSQRPWLHLADGLPCYLDAGPDE